MQKNGILFIKETIFKGTDLEHTTRELYLPIFHEDREFVNSVLTDAMDTWNQRDDKKPYDESVVFYEIADSIGRERTKSHLFIGPESIPYETPDSILEHAAYVFTPNFEDGTIVTLK